MTKMKEIEKKAMELNYDMELVRKAIKANASRKCLHLKKPFVKNYDEKLTEILQEEQLLKQVRQFLDPKEKTVTVYEQEDVDKLDFDETIKAIKSIQSKKYHTRWLTPNEGDNDEYRNACRIEQMLLAHKETVKPVEDAYIRKSDLTTIIDTIKTTHDISKESIIELLERLM